MLFQKTEIDQGRPNQQSRRMINYDDDHCKCNALLLADYIAPVTSRVYYSAIYVTSTEIATKQ